MSPIMSIPPDPGGSAPDEEDQEEHGSRSENGPIEEPERLPPLRVPGHADPVGQLARKEEQPGYPEQRIETAGPTRGFVPGGEPSRGTRVLMLDGSVFQRVDVRPVPGATKP